MNRIGPNQRPAKLAVVIALSALLGVGSVASNAQEAGARTEELRQFVLRKYTHGLPIAEALKFRPKAGERNEGADDLAAMLESRKHEGTPKKYQKYKFEGYWSNIVTTLGLIGDDKKHVDVLIDFVQGDRAQRDLTQWQETAAGFEARAQAVLALGYALRSMGRNDEVSKLILGFLGEGLKPSTWSTRFEHDEHHGFERLHDLHWVFESDEERNLKLAKKSILGLGVSKNHEARKHLLELIETDSSELGDLAIWVCDKFMDKKCSE